MEDSMNARCAQENVAHYLHLISILNSPVHEQNLYHCPKCNKQAKTLAALVSHFESERCGIMAFDMVQKNIEGIVTGRRMIFSIPIRKEMEVDTIAGRRRS